MSKIIGKGYDFSDVLIVPKYNRVLSRSSVTFHTQVSTNYWLQNPLVAANMDTICESDMAIALGKLGGLGVIHRFMTIEQQAEELKKTRYNGVQITAAAVGIKDYQERAKELIRQGVNILVLDIAHGHSKYSGKALEELLSLERINLVGNKVDIIVGNIATRDAAEYFMSKGANGIKVGIGPGAVCTTRQNTGIGIPQLTAIMDVYEATKGRVPIIADGGIRTPSDLVKALGAGANSVMSGYIFAGCNEVPERGKKTYRGSASQGVKGETAFVEGTELEVSPSGPVKDVVKRYLDGLASAMTYTGKDKLKDFIGNVEFILK